MPVCSPEKCKKCIQNPKNHEKGKCYYCGNTLEYMKNDCGCADLNSEVYASCNGDLFIDDRLARKYCVSMKVEKL